MTSFFCKLWFLRSFFSSLYFNFKFLPFCQAIRLPIILYKPYFGDLSGKVYVHCDKIKFGMIKLGRNRVPLYPNNGIKLFIAGELHIYGPCDIGNDSAISISKNGKLALGDGFSATAALKLTCNNQITFEERCTIGWDCIFMDSDFHRLTKNDSGYTSGIGKIHIGSDNWFCCRNSVLKNTITPNKCVVSVQSVLSGDFSKFGECVVIGNDNKVTVKATGRYLNVRDPASRQI